MDNTSGIEDGRAWGTAFRTIQPAIDWAVEPSGGEVWVAEGVYSEDRARSSPDGSFDGALRARAGVELYGGFTGGETERGQRDWQAHVTVIDGSQARRGQPAYHVIKSVGDETVLDGFTVQGGNANGLYADDRITGGIGVIGAAVIANCIIRDNRSDLSVGGIGIGGAEPLIVNCTFVNNQTSQSGGAIDLANAFSRPTIIGCLFIGNRSGSAGGAIGGGFGGDLVVRDSIFLNNESGFGGAIGKFSEDLTLENCLFIGNHGWTGGAVSTGGEYEWELGVYGTHVSIRNCTFFANVAAEGSGAVHNGGAVTTVWNSIFWNNTPLQIVNNVTAFPPPFSVHHSLVQGGYEGEGNLELDPQFVDAIAGDVRLRPTSPAIDAGTAVDAPAADIRGVARPQGAGVDIGAYEYQTGDELDIDASGGTDAVDVQLVINGALGLDSRASSDVDGNSVVDAIDVQLVINAALGKYEV
ncbi:MAG: hypothetical protein HY706_21305 [Candidatus Hydrogenedentes bacterium]|nr:hypothetical protein [Candidatus Hydrogenedentota bacterium]